MAFMSPSGHQHEVYMAQISSSTHLEVLSFIQAQAPAVAQVPGFSPRFWWLQAFLGCRWPSSPCVSTSSSLCAYLSLGPNFPFCKDTSPVELGPTLMTASRLDHLEEFYGPNKVTFTGLGTSASLGGPSSVHNTFSFLPGFVTLTLLCGGRG